MCTITNSSSQEHLNKETLLSLLYLEFVNIVNEVGVDINDALAHPYTAGLLQFVCGLGPRKAAHILKVGVCCMRYTAVAASNCLFYKPERNP